MSTRVKTIVILCVSALAVLCLTKCSVSPDGNGGTTGKLRILVTDKPFPLNLIEEATVVITRVDVRRAEGAPQCTAAADCADDLFCNGVESCVDGTCVTGDFPCNEGEFCQEGVDACLTDCAVDADCDDGLYCNGTESCDSSTSTCVVAASPCTDDEACDEVADACVPDGDAGDDDGNDDSAWLTVFEGEKSFSLLDLQNGRTDLLADTELVSGRYTQTRLVVKEGRIKLIGVPEPFVLKVPSGEQTGIKLHFTFEITGGEETVLLLDVDLSRAFRPIPGGRIDDPASIRTFHFTPSVAMKLINLVDAGTITGVVVDDAAIPLEDVVVTAYDDSDDEVGATGSEPDGSFALGGLHAGTYRLEFTLLNFEDAAVTGVVVVAGESTDVGEVTMTAAP